MGTIEARATVKTRTRDARIARIGVDMGKNKPRYPPGREATTAALAPRMPGRADSRGPRGAMGKGTYTCRTASGDADALRVRQRRYADSATDE